MSKKTKKKIDQGFNDEDHEKKLEKLKEKLADISDEDEPQTKLTKNLFEIQNNQKSKKNKQNKQDSIQTEKKIQSKFFESDETNEKKPENIVESKQELKKKKKNSQKERVQKITKEIKESEEMKQENIGKDNLISEQEDNDENEEEEEEIEDLYEENENESESEIIEEDFPNNKGKSKKDNESKKSKKKLKDPKQIKEEKEKEEEMHEEFKKAIWDQIWLIAIIGVFFMMVTFSKYYEEKYTKYARYMFSNKENFRDFYEILEIDSSASTAEIRQQYKKLAIIWHPDKNPNCGSPCQEKFQEILQAYEVLGNDEKRRSYDEMLGVVTPIKSKTISLTEANFERLVLETNDVWIIQIYEDANPWCEQIAALWDEIADEYADTVKFGRINIGTQRNVLKFLPINIVFLPTILSMVKGYESEIFILSRDFMGNMRKFILHVIASKFKYLGVEKFKRIYEQTNQTDLKIPEFLYLQKSATLPINFKYYAFIHNGWMNFYSSNYRDIQDIKRYLGKKQSLDLAIFYYNFHTNNRTKVEFVFSQEINSRTFKQLIDFSKFLTIPDINKNNFREYCQHDEGRAIMDQGGLFDLPFMCILLVNPQNETKKAIYEKKIFQIINDQVQKIVENIKKLKPAFEFYSTFQFAWIDLDFHTKFKKNLKMVQEKQEDFILEDLKAFGLLPNNKKISSLTNIINLEDWILDLIDTPETQQYIYISETFNEDLSHYLKNYDDNFWKCYLQECKKCYKDNKIVIGCLCLVLSLLFYKFKIKPISYQIVLCLGIGFYLLSLGAMSLTNIKEDY